MSQRLLLSGLGVEARQLLSMKPYIFLSVKKGVRNFIRTPFYFEETTKNRTG